MKAMTLTMFALLAAIGASAQQAPRSTPFTKPFADLPGKEGTVLTVDLAPGASGQVHRHDAHVFVYVLEGQVVMQVAGGAAQTLEPGQMFYESPADVHTVSRNASPTKPATFLVFMVKNVGAPVTLPAP